MNKKYVPLDTNDVGKKKIYELKTWKQNNLDCDGNFDDLSNNSNQKSGKPKELCSKEKCSNPFSTKLNTKPTIHTSKVILCIHSNLIHSLSLINLWALFRIVTQIQITLNQNANKNRIKKRKCKVT